jgi:hypothetical protein
VFSVERGAFGLHEVGLAVFAVVALVVGGGVFTLFYDVFVLLFLVVGAFWVLANDVVLVVELGLGHVFPW